MLMAPCHVTGEVQDMTPSLVTNPGTGDRGMFLPLLRLVVPERRERTSSVWV
jgi:hypothetical protein